MNGIIIFIAKDFIFVPLIASIVVAYQLGTSKQRLTYAVALIMGGILALIMAHFAGLVYNNPRPFVVGHFAPLIPHVSDNGFPSDHTLFAALIGGTTLRYSRKYGIFILTIALLIGLARVLAGVHHIEDIIGSFVISGIATLIVGIVLEKIPLTRKI